MTQTKTSKVLIILLVLFYALSVVLSYSRIYVFQAYPVYYSENDMPEVLDLFSDIPSLLLLP